MRCYGCNSRSHLLKDCTVIQRPAEVKLEFENVFDINNRVQSLNTYAILRCRSPVTVHSIRAAMIKRFWEVNWQGRIIPIDKYSFLVGFVDECRRDSAVLAEKVNFGDFSGTFYEWNESWGAIKVCTPVYVWITLEGLPLQCWGEEEIKVITSSFGTLHKISDSLYQKNRADVVKVMVEVEDISVIPKVIQCSYKAITDNRYLYFNVKLNPSAYCLPVSECNKENFKSFEEGGSGESLEDGWVSGSAVPRRGGAARRVPEEEAADMEEVDQVVARLAPKNMNAHDEAQGEAQAQAGGMFLHLRNCQRKTMIE